MVNLFTGLTIESLIPSGIFWGSCIFLHKKLGDITYERGISLNLLDMPPLYDVVQESFPNLQKYRMIPEVLHIIPIALLLIYTTYYKNIHCLKKFLLNHGTLMLLRGISFSVTLLPDSSRMCHLSNHLGSCFDLLFSGHSTIMFLCSLLLSSHFPLSLKWKVFLFSNTIITSFLIIVCRNHYTIDVLYSILLTYLIFKIQK
jgi:hypothetical protein